MTTTERPSALAGGAESTVEPAQSGIGAVGGFGGLLRRGGGGAVPGVGVVVGAARQVDGDEQDAVALPHHVLDVLTVGGVRVVIDLGLREHPQPAAAERAAGRREEDRPHESEVVDRVAAGVVDQVAVGVRDVVDLLGGGVVGPAAFLLLVAVGPLVVAGRVDQRVGEVCPQIGDLLVVRLGAILTAGMDVADVQHRGDGLVGVDRADECRGGVGLAGVGRGRAVRRVAVDGVAERAGVVVIVAGVMAGRRDSRGGSGNAEREDDGDKDAAG